MKTLEIGTGQNEYSLHLENALHLDVSKNAFCVETLGDCHKLPFADKTFETIYISHVLEHCHNPLLVLKELDRVAKKTIILIVPNNDFYSNMSGESLGHFYSWNMITFKQLLGLVFKDVELKSRYFVRYGNSKIRNLKSRILFQFYRKLHGDNEIIAVIRL